MVKHLFDKRNEPTWQNKPLWESIIIAWASNQRPEKKKVEQEQLDLFTDMMLEDSSFIWTKFPKELQLGTMRSFEARTAPFRLQNSRYERTLKLIQALSLV